MKIYLSKYRRKNFWVIFCLLIFIILGTIAFCCWSGSEEDYIFVLCALVAVISLTGLLLTYSRFLTYAIVKKNTIKSYSFFNKELCTVELEKTIYYAVFTSAPVAFGEVQFIAVSNEPFECKEERNIIRKNRFIMRYNINKIIIMPYDKTTKLLFDAEHWKWVN